jgi:hypothetical protein
MRAALHLYRQKQSKDSQWYASLDSDSHERAFRLHGVSPQVILSGMMLRELKGAVVAAELKGIRKSSVCEQAITHGLWRRRRIAGDGHAI